MSPQALQTLQTATYILTFINLVWTVTNIIIAIAGKAKAPNVRQDERITALETRMKAAEDHLDADNKRLQQIERGNTVTQKAILALMRHALDGNNLGALSDAERELNDYLVSR